MALTNIFAKLSIFLSSLCVVHCLATPLVLLLLPALSTLFTRSIEIWLVLSVIPLSMVGFFPTWFRHKNYRLLALYLTSIALILFSQFVLHVSHDHAEQGIHLMNWVSTGITFTGALLLAWVIFQNNRHTHYCTHPHHNQDTARPIMETHSKPDM